MSAGREAYGVAELAAEARSQTDRVRQWARPLGDEEFAWRGEDGRWSVGECLDHLTLSNRIYLDAIDAAIEPGRAAGLTAEGGTRRRRRRHGWIGDMFVRSLEPPVKLKVKAFDGTVPAPQRERGVVLRDFEATQDRLVRTIEAAADLDLAAVRMRSPLFRLLRLSLGQAFGVMLAHNRRHLWQAERTVEYCRRQAAGATTTTASSQPPPVSPPRGA